MKWIVLMITLLVLILLTVVVARLSVRKDNERSKEVIKKEINEDALRTIAESKRFLREVSEKEKDGGMVEMQKVNNKYTLGELLALEPEDKDYEEFVELIGMKVKQLFEQYQFFMYEPNKEDLVSGYLLQFQIMGHEPVYNELFVMAMDRGLDMDKVDRFFMEALETGKIIPIGDGILIEKDGTGVSPIKSGDDVRVIISFVTEEYKERQEKAEAEKNEGK